MEFNFNQELFDKIISWYGLEGELLPLLKEYFILYTLFDTYMCKNAGHKDRDFLLESGIYFLDDICKRF